MNTLNYKVLLIKTNLLVFTRAIGIYLLITLPAMAAEPYLYLLSAAYAISFGWIAAALFLLLFYIVKKIKADILVKNILLYTSVAIAVVVAFQMMEVTGAQYRIWQSGAFLLFPAFAIISGWISLAVSRHTIKSLFAPGDSNCYEAIISNTVSDK
jgi:hypothetical protein